MNTGHALLLISLIVAGIYFFTSSEQSTPTTNIHATDNLVDAHKEIATLTEENQRYKNELQSLMQTHQQTLLELAQLQQQSKAQKGKEAYAVNLDNYEETNLAATPRPDTPPIEQILAANEIMREVPEYLSAFSGAPSEINADLKKKFDAEAADPEWAETQEIKLHQLFSISDTLSKYNPESISCKSTRCQIKIPISDYDESNEVISSLSKMLENNELGLENALVFTVPDLSKGYVDYYVGRNSSVKLYQ